jgi:signal transduction histidine kinase
MSSTRLRDLPRTTGFRVALLFMGLFTLLAVLLFSLVYWQTSAYLTSRVDDFLHREAAPLYALPPAVRIERLQEHATADSEQSRPFGIFSAAGEPVAGNLRVIPAQPLPLGRPFAFTLAQGGAPTAFRGLAETLPDGKLLIVADELIDHQAFKAQLLRWMVRGGVLIIILGAIGAVVVAAEAVRRIDAVTNAIERIMRGNLAERLPTRGDQGDVDRLATAVNRMLAEIERLMGEIMVVCDGIAHDLRTPLTRMLSGLERVRRRPSTVEDYVAAVDHAIGEVGDLLQTFNAMLRIAEIDHGERRAGFTTVDLAVIAQDVVELYEPTAEAKSIRLSWTAPPGATEMQGDPSLLFEAVGNLVDNAIKFTPEHGRVTVSVDRGGIVVRDDGPGIPPQEIEAMLTPFRRGERSRQSPGSGLGLTLVQAVARLHALNLVIEASEPGCKVALGPPEQEGDGTA